jgi:hypothetical protein
MIAIQSVLVAAALFLAAASANAQTGVRPDIVIGGENSRETELGVFSAVVILPQYLVVLEGDAPFIKLFDHRGFLVQSIGRKGDGPGEFRAATAAAYDAAKRELVVVDRLARRLSRFAVGDSLAFVSAYVTPVNEMRGVCVVDAKTYVSGTLGDSLIHELAVEGNRMVVRRSLGTRRSTHKLADHPIYRRQVGWGHMSCDARSQRIFYVALGDLHTIDIRSGEHSVVAMPNFTQRIFEATGPQRMTALLPPGGVWHDALAVMPLAGAAVVTIGTRDQAGGTSPEGVLTSFAQVTMTATGIETARTSHRWQPIGTSGRYAVCAVLDPVPTIGYFSRGACP